MLEQAESVTHANIALIGLFIFSQSPEAEITSVRQQFVELSYANSVAMKNRPEGRFFFLLLRRENQSKVPTELPPIMID